jgi:transposase
MARLTSRARKRLKKGSFAIPGKRAYPIHDRRHAANALSRVSQHGSSSQKARVRAAVCRRYPSLPSCK